MTGRPSIYSDDLARTICTRLALGESLRTICDDPDMPHRSTIYDWLHDNREFTDQYTRAREDQAETYAGDIVDIADTEEDPQRARVRIDARKWHASKLAPKKYGDKIQTTLTGVDDGPVKMTVDGFSLVPLSALTNRKKESDDD